MQLTQLQLSKIIPGNQKVEQWCESLDKILPDNEINSLQRVAAFLAQCAHESANFTVLVENLNYSAAGLMATWPKRFASSEFANKYARKPEMIANRVYADRLGNGSEASGDGWRYRGQGLIQLTGYNNQFAFANSIGLPVTDMQAYLITFEGAVNSACWFWKTNDLNKWADIGDIEKMTKIINGGLVGIDDRKKKYAMALSVLGE